MIRKSVHQQASSLRIFALCFAVLLLSGSGAIARSANAASSVGKEGPKSKAKPQVSSVVAARFLEQASWGPTAATIAQVQQAADLPTYLQTQFTAPITYYTTPGPSDKLNVVQNQLFVNAMTGQDQLRQRVSFALSEIIVISGVGTNIKSPTAFSLWMNMLQNDAFGNFYNLLNDVTLSPSMGSYLNMANNNGCKTNCRPNENYARELLQLFSIGLYQLNIDGTPQLDQNGNLIPTYGQDTIDGFGALFTGWAYPPTPPSAPHFFNKPYYSGPMLPYQQHYSRSSKVLLNGLTLPANGNIQADLTTGLQSVFNHPNVGPFISEQLIQKLVTSNPSPAYVSRIAERPDRLAGPGVEGARPRIELLQEFLGGKAEPPLGGERPGEFLGGEHARLVAPDRRGRHPAVPDGGFIERRGHEALEALKGGVLDQDAAKVEKEEGGFVHP